MTHYVMIGINVDEEKLKEKHGKDDEFWDYYDLLPLLNNDYNEKIEIITDCMAGEYCIIGRVINKSEKCDGLSLTDCSGYEEESIVIAAHIKKTIDIKGEAKVWAFTDWK